MTDSIVRYGSFDDKAFDEQAQEVDDLAGSQYLKIGEGETVLRFLPPPVGRNTPFRVTSLHFINAALGFGLTKTYTFACPRLELKQPCPVCAKADEMARAGNPLDRERANKIKA